MKTFLAGLVFHAVAILVVCPSTSGFLTIRATAECTGRDGNPYYFGTTDLLCMSSKGKRAPERGTSSISHRWIYYQGFYFERLSDRDTYGIEPSKANKCTHEREAVPAGYSKLSVDCVKKCTDRYQGHYGSYCLFTNNCHFFANRLSEILCNSSTCPSWCH